MTYKQKNIVNLIRSTMRLHGKSQVWNNLYEGGVRTVKCYRYKEDERDLELKGILSQTLHDLNIDYQIKFTEPSDGPWNPGTGGFIVKLPVEA
jgi:hypothetical protein